MTPQVVDGEFILYWRALEAFVREHLGGRYVSVYRHPDKWYLRLKG